MKKNRFHLVRPDFSASVALALAFTTLMSGCAPQILKKYADAPTIRSTEPVALSVHISTWQHSEAVPITEKITYETQHLQDLLSKKLSAELQKKGYSVVLVDSSAARHFPSWSVIYKDFRKPLAERSEYITFAQEQIIPKTKDGNFSAFIIAKGDFGRTHGFNSPQVGSVSYSSAVPCLGFDIHIANRDGTYAGSARSNKHNCGILELEREHILTNKTPYKERNFGEWTDDIVRDLLVNFPDIR